MPFYKEVKEDYFKSNTEFQDLFTSDTRHACETEKSDKLFTDIVNNCVITKVAQKYLHRLSEFAEWAKTNFQKGEPALKEFFVDARFVGFFPFGLRLGIVAD